IRRTKLSYAPAFARPAAVMWNGRHVTDRRDHETGRLQRAQRRLAARTGARNLDLERAHAVLLRLLGRILTGDLRRIRRRLARPLEAHGAGGRPRYGVALRIGDRDHRVVERGVHVRHAGRDVLFFASANTGGFFTHNNPRHARGRAGSRLSLLTAVLFLLAGDGLGWAFAGARVGVGALSTNRQAAPVTQSAVAAEIHQPLDVHRNLAPQVAFAHVVAVAHLAGLQHFLIRELRHPARLIDVHLLHDLLSLRRADAMDVLQGDLHPLIRRYVNPSDTGHSLHSCRQPTSVSPLSGCKSSINAHTTPSPVVGPGIVAALFAYWVPGIYGFHPGPSTSITAYSTISACCARPCAGLLLLRQDPRDRFGDVVDFGHAVHGPQGALVPVERDQWRGLRPIGLESLVQRRRVVVGPQRVAARR